MRIGECCGGREVVGGLEVIFLGGGMSLGEDGAAVVGRDGQTFFIIRIYER